MTINKEKIIRRVGVSTKPISIRVPISAKKFMTDKKYSPTAILMEALKELGWKQ